MRSQHAELRRMESGGEEWPMETLGPLSTLEANLANGPRGPIVEQGQSSIVANPKTFISTE